MSFWNEPSRSDRNYEDGKTERHYTNRCVYERSQLGNGQYLLQQDCYCSQRRANGEEIHYDSRCDWVFLHCRLYDGTKVYFLRKDCYCGGRPQQQRPNASYLPWNQTSRRW
ncbi:hypothetical protein Bbelb_171810 [Branchiostoma belcheri]|nr:hypothetical protein Bbelb_171810 [Branchiostoma belcheri]